MVDRSDHLPRDVDLGVLGKTMLDAARAAGIGVTVTLLREGIARNIYVSDAAAEIMGWPTEEILSRPLLAHVDPDALPMLRERLDKRLGGETGQARYEITVVRADGRRRSVEVTSSDAILNGGRAVIAFIVDVTARRAAEEARFRAEASFRELIEKAPEPIVISRTGFFVYANAAFVDALGYPSAAALYVVPIEELVHPDEAARLEARSNFVVDEGRPPPYTYHVRRRDGSIMLLETTSVPFEYEGRASILTMGRDVTERQLLQTRLVQTDRLAALGTMAAGVAHEINNPLAYLMLNLDWTARKLAEGPADPQSMESFAEMLQEARRGAARVTTIVRELRSFSRADGEKRQAVDLATVVKSSVRIAGHEIHPRAQISISLESVGPVWADEGRLEQVILNLLLNAAHALPESQRATNEIRVCVRPGAEGNAVLEVTDNGEGISPDVVPRIFDPFFTTKPPGKGTGLGLSICHGIIASLGGQITVHSIVGEGTTFRVSLPTTDARKGESPPPSNDTPAAPGVRRARVLVVDDEVQLANTLRELLASEHHVVATTSGADALTAIRSGEDFDVVLCDLMMPGMDGMELYEHIRMERPGLERRIVFMTGGAFTATAAEFLGSIENRRVEKPFSLRLVERIVRETRSQRGRSS